ncbi:MAG: alpha-hydroxy-acid oxidizing protein [Treponema sp.]|jgi:isopentenyl diphosphate isomerase/L-lactate dehydrogenase-like FMN-dependent dehydrogenase|nr:alpha-hydroxy-acid oxidizing protein [Treponema sp.]
MAEQTGNPGDAGKITRDYFDSLLVEMRHIDAVMPSTKLELYGHSFETPVMMAALSHLGNVRPRGMEEAAKGMLAAGGVNWCGMGDEQELEAICATGAKTIKIIKPYKDNKDIFRKIEHAEKCGCIAVGMDVDHQFGSKAKWWAVGEYQMRPKTLEEIKSFVKATSLPFIIKGVLSEQDTYKCLNAGVRGIVVSHHHGMVDYALPPLKILPKIVKIVDKRIPIFVDCEIVRGLDVFKAIALGAAACSGGRVFMGPLGEKGAQGVTEIVEAMTHELAWAMAVTCSPDLNHIDPSVIWEK